MLNWALAFLIAAIVNAILGFGGVLPPSVEPICRVFFVIHLMLFVTSLMAGKPWRP
jgi:uncharacterized membrane protein YtjA (UPF0391 family)